jgi:hypothetical protein
MHNNQIAAILNTITPQKEFNEDAYQALQEICFKFPYFGWANLLRAKAMINSGNNYQGILQAANIHHSKPIWFQGLLNEKNVYAWEASMAQIEKNKAAATNEDFNSTIITPNVFAPVEEAIGTDTVFLAENEIQPPNENDTQIESFEVKPEEINEASIATQVENNEPISEESVEFNPTKLALEQIEDNNTASPTEQPIQEVLPIETNSEIEISTESSIEQPIEAAVAPKFTIAPIGAVPTTNEPLAFEPYHTVDYFASQGIKIDEKMLQSDKLGKQLKSFTDWLKTMKKIHPDKLARTGDLEPNPIISLKSPADEEILTEAMAVVYIKQGLNDKAIGLYEKLSLLNPAKSAYCAAQIKNLK